MEMENFDILNLVDTSVDDLYREENLATWDHLRARETRMKWRRRVLTRVLKKVRLTATQKRVLLLTFKHNKSQNDIAKLLKVSRQSVADSLKSAISRVQKACLPPA